MAQKALVVILNEQLQRIVEIVWAHNYALIHLEENADDPLLQLEVEFQEHTLEQAVMSYRRND